VLIRVTAAGVLGPGQPTTYALADGPKALTELEARATSQDRVRPESVMSSMTSTLRPPRPRSGSFR
jgi:hypothetical protein